MKFREQDIKLLLENYLVESSASYSFKDYPYDEDERQDEVEKDLSVIEFIHVQINSIRKLYVQYSPSDKIQCKNYLLEFLAEGNNILFSQIALNALVHLGAFDEALEIIRSKYISKIKFYSSLLETLGEILKNEWNIFTKEQIDKLYIWTGDILDGKNALGKEFNEWRNLYKDSREVIYSLWRQLNIIKTKHLKEEIFSETSQEITSDQEALKLEFKRNNFPDHLSETLNKIDLKIATANDNFDYKGCMDLIRSFSEELFKHIAESLDPTDGRKINGKDSEEAAKFFVTKKLISPDQGKVLVALRHFLSNDGVHRLKSRPDDARLSRNMMIEIGLYLLLRLKDIKE